MEKRQQAHTDDKRSLVVLPSGIDDGPADHAEPHK
jgi:hypothetical protein